MDILQELNEHSERFVHRSGRPVLTHWPFPEAERLNETKIRVPVVVGGKAVFQTFRSDGIYWEDETIVATDSQGQPIRNRKGRPVLVPGCKLSDLDILRI